MNWCHVLTESNSVNKYQIFLFQKNKPIKIVLLLEIKQIVIAELIVLSIPNKDILKILHMPNCLMTFYESCLLSLLSFNAEQITFMSLTKTSVNWKFDLPAYQYPRVPSQGTKPIHNIKLHDFMTNIWVEKISVDREAHIASISWFTMEHIVDLWTQPPFCSLNVFIHGLKWTFRRPTWMSSIRLQHYKLLYQI